MRSGIFCLALLGLLAVSAARTEMNLAHHLVKRALITTRALSTQCQQAGRSCAMTLNNSLSSLNVNDSQLEAKLCRATRTFYDCIKSGTSSCQDAQLTSALNNLLSEGRANCPREFQGASLLQWETHRALSHNVMTSFNSNSPTKSSGKMSDDTSAIDNALIVDTNFALFSTLAMDWVQRSFTNYLICEF